jgi:hypothetical protein
LASAAALDYVLMLATQTADGIARAVDDALLLLRAIAASNDRRVHAFVRDGVRTLQTAIAAENLAGDKRRFALLALAHDVSA